MKKLYLIMAIGAISVSLSAQDTLRPIGWIAYPTATDWSITPVTKNMVTIAKAPADWTFDENNFDLSTFWTNPGLGTENQIKNQTLANGGLTYLNGKLGATWKAWYDDANLYVGVKYSDKNLLIRDQTRGLEIMYQTEYMERYEPGFIKATSILGKNQQYARYRNLGGQKITILDGGIFSAAETNDGLGAWNADATIGANPPIIVWTVDGSNVAWVTVQLSFADHLYYRDDATNPDANVIAFDPALHDTIAWDMKANSEDAGGAAGTTSSDQWFWNSTLNDGFEANYYSGYLKFGSDVLASVSKAFTLPTISVYLADNMIQLKGIESGNLKVYNVLGQMVKSADKVNELFVGDLKNGMYIVKLNNYSQTFKVVKR